MEHHWEAKAAPSLHMSRSIRGSMIIPDMNIWVDKMMRAYCKFVD